MSGGRTLRDWLSSQATEPQASPPSASIPCAGDAFTVAYPFCRSTYSGFDGVDGYADIPTWAPGHRYETTGPEDSAEVADAEGTATFTVVAVFKPGRFPTRVFYTRKFVNPDGKEFGKGGLKIATLDKFRRLTRGYRFAYGIGEPLPAKAWGTSRERFERELAIATEARRAETLGSVHEGAGSQDIAR